VQNYKHSLIFTVKISGLLQRMPAHRLPPVAQINASLSANRQLGQEFPENGKAQGYHTPIAC